jgi:hypothetical protein
VRRKLLGLIALGFFAIAVIVSVYPPLMTYQAAGLMGLRIGMLLGVLWLAWSDLGRLPRWLWFAVPIGIVVIVYARGVLVYAAPLLATVLAVYLLYRRLRRSV